MKYQTILYFFERGDTVAKKSISISLWPLLIFAWFVWGIFDDDEKDELKKSAIEVVVETKEILIERKDGTLTKIEDMTNEEIETETGIEIVIVETPEEEQAGSIGPLPEDEEDEHEPEPKGRKL